MTATLEKQAVIDQIANRLSAFSLEYVSALNERLQWRQATYGQTKSSGNRKDRTKRKAERN